ncbi:MAG TPA: hypothetical protein VF784_09970 [Anaerolineales bacterium]
MALGMITVATAGGTVGAAGEEANGGRVGVTGVGGMLVAVTWGVVAAMVAATIVETASAGGIVGAAEAAQAAVTTANTKPEIAAGNILRMY